MSEITSVPQNYELWNTYSYNACQEYQTIHHHQLQHQNQHLQNYSYPNYSHQTQMFANHQQPYANFYERDATAICKTETNGVDNYTSHQDVNKIQQEQSELIDNDNDNDNDNQSAKNLSNLRSLLTKNEMDTCKNLVKTPYTSPLIFNLNNKHLLSDSESNPSLADQNDNKINGVFPWMKTSCHSQG